MAESVADERVALITFVDGYSDVARDVGVENEVDVLALGKLEGKLVHERQKYHLSVVYPQTHQLIILVVVCDLDEIVELCRQSHQDGWVGSLLFEVGLLGRHFHCRIFVVLVGDGKYFGLHFAESFRCFR